MNMLIYAVYTLAVKLCTSYFFTCIGDTIRVSFARLLTHK